MLLFFFYIHNFFFFFCSQKNISRKIKVAPLFCSPTFLLIMKMGEAQKKIMPKKMKTTEIFHVIFFSVPSFGKKGIKFRVIYFFLHL
ncbi:hypothetical protein HANVADRAFT_79949 [Hanseniaspora valbyensis NRRL Y-1626]|uniref:Secreted protein n=1 Tax=Hanseniaspora valbyensis NRRL Y-1626 TaxID=766949 RepID=A0A1B7T926_9ASCO|nr:hypothetical protein HANVADRAFT_79949 [Hanseniaspora valbyensis NRRL Y-1626]